MLEVFSGAGVEEMGINVQDLFGHLMPKRKRKRKLPVREARKILEQEEAQKLIDMDEVTSEAVRARGAIRHHLSGRDRQGGGEGRGAGPDVSREGVQRDILPIVEGSTVMTKYGPVRTDHILFIAAGAFHLSKPSDLIPELQGRFPIRVELDSLTREDFLQDLDRTAKRPGQTVRRTPSHRRRRGGLYRRRDRRGRPVGPRSERTDGEHRRSPAAHHHGAPP